MTIELITIAFFVLILYFVFKHVSDVKWQKLPLQNFPFIYKGKEFWYSRSVAVIHFVFAKDKNNEWCVLTNKRGDGTPDFQGFWNVPCGYLDFNESGEEAAQRETYEETNVYVRKENINFFAINTSPSENRQNVSISYYSIIDNIDEFCLNSDNSEKNEVKDIKWVKISELNNYNWAFNHDKLISNIFENKINIK